MNTLSILFDDAVLTIELAVAVVFIAFQFYFFIVTARKIHVLKNIFPEVQYTESNIHTVPLNSTEVKMIALTNDASIPFSDIVHSINKYLGKNSGAVDYEIIKSIVDRKVESYRDEILSQINVPLYIGLMGTFAGIIAGLLNIGFRGGITEANISSFIAGVIIAMTASFFGLLLTVINNAGILKNANTTIEKRKNEFFNFLQIELLPNAGSGLSDVVNRFRDNLNRFNINFGQSIHVFEENISDKVDSLGKSVSLVANHIAPLVENTKTNYAILTELRSLEFQQMTRTNLKLTEALESTLPKVNEFMKRQEELNHAVEKTVHALSIIESIMNRLKIFEDSINGFGKNINNLDYTGSDLLEKVNKKLQALDDQYELLKQHSQFTKGHIEAHFVKETKKIETETEKALERIQESFRFRDNSPFMKLDLLETMEKDLSQIQNQLKNQESLKTLADDLKATRNYLGEIKDNFNNVITMNHSGTWPSNNVQSTENGSGNGHRPKKRSLWRKIFPFLMKQNG